MGHSFVLGLLFGLLIAGAAMITPRPYGQSSRQTITIADDSGGIIANYIAKYQVYRAADSHLIIDRYCASSCTLFIGIIERGNVCVTRRAVLGFHGAWGWTIFGHEELPESTKVMLRYYNDPVRAWIKQHGGIHTSRVMRLMKYPETAQYFRICR